MINPTIHANPGDIARLPYYKPGNTDWIYPDFTDTFMM